MSEGEQADWKGTTYGSSKLHNALIWLLRHVNTRCVYWFSGFFIVPACLLFNKSGRVSYRRFRVIHSFTRLSSLRWAWLSHYRFAQVIIDRFAMYAGKRFNIEVDGMELFEELASKPDGFLQLSSHVGNYELAGYSLVAKTKTFCALVYGGETESVMRHRQQMFASTNIRMIPTQPDMSHLFHINSALSDGNIVSMPADRMFGSTKSLTLPFMGHDAQFPVGPFAVARSRGCKVISVNVIKSGVDSYKVFVTPVTCDQQAKPADQLRTLAQSYVKSLERVVREYPDQWFNFYDFWNE